MLPHVNSVLLIFGSWDAVSRCEMMIKGNRDLLPVRLITLLSSARSYRLSAPAPIR